MQKRIVVAQLGCGYWGPNLLRNFSADPNCLVKWVAEPSLKRQEYVRESFPKSTVTRDWKTPLVDPEVEAIIVATHASSHYEITKEALLAGKHVFVEKPLAMNTQEATELVDIAKSRKLTLMVGHTFLYNAAVRYLKKLIDEGEIGDIYYIYAQRLNLGQVRSDVNAWWNLAPHDISILNYLMGSAPVSVTATGVDYIQDGIQDIVFATLTWQDKRAAHVHVSWLDPSKTRKVIVVGSKKMVVYDDVAEDKILVFNKGVDKVPVLGESMDYDAINRFKLQQRAGDILIPKIAFQEPLKVEAAHFIESIRNGTEPLTGAEHGLEVVRVLEAGQQSLDIRSTVKLSEIGPRPAAASRNASDQEHDIAA